MSNTEKRDLGSYDAVLKRMLNALPAVTVTIRDKIVHPLARFNRTAKHDFTLSLLSGWAIIADIVRFYRDRISEEGYLSSAIEDRSVDYLGRFLGYQKWPGEAAATWLALTVSSTALPQQSAGTGIVSIPQGGNLVVQDIPSSGAQPVIFESHDAVEARVEWNDLRPFTQSPSQAPAVFNGMTGIRLAGQVTSLRSGSRLLIQTQSQSFFRTVDQIQVQPDAPFTLVTWSTPLDPEATALNQIQYISTFRQQAGLFGRKAAAWSTVPDSVRQKVGTRAGGILSRPKDASAWRSAQANLPPLPLQALAVGPDGHIVVGTSKGLYTTPQPGEPWTAITTSPAQQSVLSLLVNDLGFLYTGGTRGAVSLSTDNGQSWQSLRGPVNIGNGRLDGCRGFWAWLKRLVHFHNSPKPVAPTPTQPPTSLDGVIRVLAECTWQDTRYLLAGTDRGIFFLRAGGLDWTTYSEGLPGHNRTTGLSSTVVSALYPAPSICTSATFAATDSGLYIRKFDASFWKQVHLPGVSPQPKVFALAEYNRLLFAGTSQGLYSSSDGRHWEQVAGHNLPSTVSFRSLAPYTHDLSSGLLVGTDQGAWFTKDGGTNWQQLACQQLHVFCLSLAFADALDQCDLSPTLFSIFAAHEHTLPDDAIIKVVTPGSEWDIESPSNPPCSGFTLKKQSSSITVHQTISLNINDVRLVATLPTGDFLIASPTGHFLEDDWPDFHPCSSTIALDRIVSDLLPGARVVLHQDQPQPVTVFANIEDAEQRPVQAWGRQATVSVITLSNICGHLELLRQRDATLYCRPNQLTASALDDSTLTPVFGNSITISGAIPNLGAKSPIAIVGKPPTAVLPIAGGVFLHREPTPKSQTQILPFMPHGLSQENIIALASGGEYLWAFADGVGLYYCAEYNTQPEPGCPVWKPAPGNGAPASATCLLWLNNILYVATNSNHIYQYQPLTETLNTGAEIPAGEWKQDTSSPQEILSLAADDKGTLYAGTVVEGVYTYSPRTGIWTRLKPSLTLTQILALIIAPDGTLYIGAAEGVFRLDEHSGFTRVGAPLDAQTLLTPPSPLASNNANFDIFNVTAFVLHESTLYVGTRQGEVFSLLFPNGSWTFVSTPRLLAPISTIAYLSPSTLIVGTHGEGLCTLNVESGISTPVIYSASNDITALLALTSSAYLVGASSTSILSANSSTGINAQRSPVFVTSTAFTTMLDLQAVPRELATVFLRYVPTFANPSVSAVIKGQCWVIRTGALSFLLHLRDAGLKSAQIAVDQIDTFAAHSCDDSASSDSTQWTLDSGFQSAFIRLSKDTRDILFCPALPGIEANGEVAEITAVKLSSTTEATQLTLTKPLVNLYDPHVTSLNANLAYATQGVTVPLEILGSGNAATTHQRFQLRRPPVTYARRQPQDEPTCSLQVRVNSSSSPNSPPPSAVSAAPIAPKPNGERWKQVPSFFNVAPGDNAYTFTIDADGSNFVQFGDGIQGSRLPTGIDNVAASYRSGLGAQGNIDAGSLVVFRKRPLGIRSVANPVPAKGGSNPEPASSSRVKIRQWTFTLDRIVSLQDYENFCLAQSNILKAQVTQLPPDSDDERIRITVATRNQLPLRPGNAGHAALFKDIQAASARAYPFSIDAFDALYFQLALRITVAPFSDKDNLRRTILNALLSTFSFANRSFAQNVVAAEIVAVIQPLPLVQSVDIQSLHLRGELPLKLKEIQAKCARWDARRKKVLPAQLLLFDPSPDAANIQFVDSQ